MIRVFIGFDSRETVAYHTLAHSILRRSSVPVSITPLVRNHLRMEYLRDRDPMASTDFSDTRFLVPWLCGYRGWAVFMDCDQLMLSDVAALHALRDESKAVMVRQHDHVPRETSKFLGASQTRYEKKNWSSLMLMNCESCFRLTPYYVSRASMLELHQFKWLDSEEQIGDLPAGWNHLVGYDAPNPDAKHVHYTLGGPYFNEHRECEYADTWFSEFRDMCSASQMTGMTGT